MRAITWNLFHGRDLPPNPALRTCRSRLTRRTERDATHEQVNRPLLDEFCEVLARDPWEVALLQEAPPRWAAALRDRTGASGAAALTSRNWLGSLRARLADWNPDLVRHGEGGSNQTLLRAPWRVVEARRMTLRRLPERRVLLWVLARAPDGGVLAVGNLHATFRFPRLAEREVLRAAERSVEWAGEAPLLFGGDLNLRPEQAPALFRRLEGELGLAGAIEGSIDQLLARGLEVVRAAPEPHPWRELPASGGRRLRLSDHRAVAAEFARARPEGAPS